MATDLDEPSPRLPGLSVVTIGHYRHGKTTLTAAITKVLAARPGSAATPIDVRDLDRRGGPGAWLSADATRTVVPGSLRYATEHRAFVHIDCPGHRPWLKNAARAQALADAAILVVSAPESVQPQTHEHLLLARALGLHQLVVFLTKCDEVTDLEWLDLVERDVRDLLDRSGFDANATRILRGAALPVLAGPSPWEASIRDLVDALESEFTVPAHDTAGAPLLYVHRAFNRPEFPRDVVVEGRLRRGALRRQDKLTLLGMGDAIHLRVEDLEIAHRKADHAEAGDRVGVQLHCVDRPLRARTTLAGQALVPRDAAATQELRARIDLLPQDDGGRTTPVRRGHVVYVLFGTAVMAGTLQLPEQTLLHPGQSTELTIALRTPVYLEPGMPFLLRDGNQTAAWKRGAPPRWSGTAGSGTILATKPA